MDTILVKVQLTLGLHQSLAGRFASLLKDSKPTVSKDESAHAATGLQALKCESARSIAKGRGTVIGQSVDSTYEQRIRLPGRVHNIDRRDRTTNVVRLGLRRAGFVKGGDALTQGIQGGLGTAVHVQLAQDLGYVSSSGSLGDRQLFGDLAVGLSLGDQA